MPDHNQRRQSPAPEESLKSTSDGRRGSHERRGSVSDKDTPRSVRKRRSLYGEKPPVEQSGV